MLFFLHSLGPFMFVFLSSNAEEAVNLSALSTLDHIVCFFRVSVWSVGNAAHCLGDPHQGASPTSGLQHQTVPQS